MVQVSFRVKISGEIVWYGFFAHAQLQVLSNSSSYHIRGNEMNWVGSSEYMTDFTTFTSASFLNMQADQNFVPKIDHFALL